MRDKKLRDAVHGDVYLTGHEAELVDTPEVQRLRGIRQLGAAYLVKRKEIQAAETSEEALRIRNEYADRMRDTQSGLRAARVFLFDDVIEPNNTRQQIGAMLSRIPRRAKGVRAHAIDLR